MNPIKFTKNTKELARYLRQDFPRKVGKMGEDHFKESFVSILVLMDFALEGVTVCLGIALLLVFQSLF